MHKHCKITCYWCNTQQDYIRASKYIKRTDFGMEEVKERICRFCGRNIQPFEGIHEVIIQKNEGGSIKCDKGYDTKRTFDFKTYEAMDIIDFDELYYEFEDKCYKAFDEENVEDIVQSVFDIKGNGNNSLVLVAHKSIGIIYQLMSELGSLKTGQCPVRSIIKTLAKEHPLELDEIEDTNELIKTQYHTPTGFIIKYQSAIFKNRFVIPFDEVIVNIWYLCARMLNKYNERKEANRKRIEHQNFDVINACKGSNSRQGIRKNLKEKSKYRPKEQPINDKVIVKLRKNEVLRERRYKKEFVLKIRKIKERFRNKVSEPVLHDTLYEVIWKEINEGRQSAISGPDSLAFSC
jgi:hypothetical protein